MTFTPLNFIRAIGIPTQEIAWQAAAAIISALAILATLWLAYLNHREKKEEKRRVIDRLELCCLEMLRRLDALLVRLNKSDISIHDIIASEFDSNSYINMSRIVDSMNVEMIDDTSAINLYFDISRYINELIAYFPHLKLYTDRAKVDDLIISYRDIFRKISQQLRQISKRKR